MLGHSADRARRSTTHLAAVATVALAAAAAPAVTWTAAANTASPTPLSTQLVADDPATVPGSRDGFTITIANPTANDVTLQSIQNTLPAGYTYTSGSTTGASTADPSRSGRVLTWTGPFTDPAGSSVALHFAITTPDVATDAPDTATAVVTSSSGQTVTPASTAIAVHPLQVTAIQPAAVADGTSGTFTITGTTFDAGGTIAISGTGIVLGQLTYFSSTTLTVEYILAAGAPATARTVVYSDAQSGSVTCVQCLSVHRRPTITAVTPNSVGQGAQHRPVIVTGTQPPAQR